MAFHGRGQAPYALLYLFWSGVRKIQAHVAGAFAAVFSRTVGGIERIAGHERHILLDRSLEDRLHVQPFGQRHPEKQAALRMRPGYCGREELFESLKHYVAAFAIDLTNQLDVFVEESIAGDLVGYELREGRSVQVGTLLQLRQLADDLRGRDDPSQTKAGSQRLRECAQVNDVANGIAVVAAQVLAVEHNERRKVLAFIAQLAVRVVFDNRNAVAVRQEHQFVAAAFRQGGSGRVLEVGQDVHELGAGTERHLQQVGAEAVVVYGNGLILGTINVECLQRA